MKESARLHDDDDDSYNNKVNPNQTFLIGSCDDVADSNNHNDNTTAEVYHHMYENSLQQEQELLVKNDDVIDNRNENSHDDDDDNDDNNTHLKQHTAVCLREEESFHQQKKLNSTAWMSNLLKTLLFCYSYIVLGFSLSIFGPTLLGLANNTGTEIGSMGLLFTMNGVGYVLSALIVGYMLDNLSFFSSSPKIPNPRNGLVRWVLYRLEKLIMIIGVGLIATGLFLFPLLKRFSLLVIVSFFIGLGNGSVDCTSNVMLVWTWREEVNPYMQALHFSFGVGGFICPLYVQLVNKIYTVMNIQSRWLNPLAFSYMSLGIISISASIAFMFVTFDNEAKHVLYSSGTNEFNNGSELDHSHSYSKQQQQPKRSSLQEIWIKLKKVSIKRAIVTVLTGVALLFYIGSRVGYGGLIHSYVMLLEKTRFTPDTASMLTSLFWLTFTLGRLIAIPLSKWLSVRDMLLVDIVFTMGSIAALVISSHYIVIWIGTAVIGLAMASQYPSTISLPSAHLNMKISGVMTSFMVVCGAMGEMIITPIMTSYLKHLMWILLIVCGSASIFYLILLFGIKREPDTVDDEEEQHELQMVALNNSSDESI